MLKAPSGAITKTKKTKAGSLTINHINDMPPRIDSERFCVFLNRKVYQIRKSLSKSISARKKGCLSFERDTQRSKRREGVGGKGLEDIRIEIEYLSVVFAFFPDQIIIFIKAVQGSLNVLPRQL